MNGLLLSVIWPCRADDQHCPRTALVCIENSHNRCGGCVLSLDYMQRLKAWADELVRPSPAAPCAPCPHRHVPFWLPSTLLLAPVQQKLHLPLPQPRSESWLGLRLLAGMASNREGAEGKLCSRWAPCVQDLPVHLDGARVFNAAVALGVDVKAITGLVTSVQFCLSKVSRTRTQTLLRAFWVLSCPP